MSIKLLLLKSGEDIISDVKEMNVGTEEDRKIVGYFLNKPCIVKMQDPSVVNDTEEDGKAQFSVALFPWMPLTKEDNIPIADDDLLLLLLIFFFVYLKRTTIEIGRASCRERV